jgi:putative addiction module killer protein
MYPFVYIFNIPASLEFDAWLQEIRDPVTRARILMRLDRLQFGNAGDFKMIDHRIRELRMHFGPGYRMYFVMRHGEPLLLLGGDKWTQLRDIAAARRILQTIEASS